MALRDLPAAKFPLRFEAYSKMYDDLQEAARRFANLGYGDLAWELEETRERLCAAWDKITDAERQGR